jgi:hypothetical protein
MSIEGNLKDYPFLDVIAMLSNKKETGRLQIDFNSGQGSFYFDKGELSAARVGALTGFSAVNVALSMEGTHFRFDSGILIEEAHFSDDNERLLLNSLLGVRRAVSRAGPDLSDSVERETRAALQTPAAIVTPLSAPSIAVIPTEPKLYRKDADLSFPFLTNTVTSSTAYPERRKLTFSVASILLFGILATAGIAAFRSTRNVPPSLPPQSQTPATPPSDTTRVSPSSNIEDKSGPVSVRATTATQRFSQSATPEIKPTPDGSDSRSSESKSAVSEMPSVTSRESAKEDVPAEETKMAASAFREISVVIKIENGHVAEAYVKNRQPGSEAFESTALRLARQRRYPKDAARTETIIFKIAREQ